MSEGMPSCFASFMVRPEAALAALLSSSCASHECCMAMHPVGIMHLLQQQHMLSPAAVQHAVQVIDKEEVDVEVFCAHADCCPWLPVAFGCFGCLMVHAQLTWVLSYTAFYT
jgi:hypothetical protein